LILAVRRGNDALEIPPFWQNVRKWSRVRRRAGILVAAGLVVSSLALARALTHRPPSTWPADAAVLRAAEPTFPPGFGRRRVLLDAGHGAPGNTGNRSAFCVDEQDFTRSLAEDVAQVLAASGHFEVELSRPSDALVPYAERIQLAERWGADVIVSLHSDVRGHAEPWEPAVGQSCRHDHDAPGFSLLFSDSGEPALVQGRAELARAAARSLAAAGFLPYDGGEYHAEYASDEVGGVFLDRHPESERIFVLWRPPVPSVIVETHNALDEREAKRWERGETRDAFARALMTALVAALPR
jgi:N-acetylmuramoyl-L-alanine amidase